MLDLTQLFTTDFRTIPYAPGSLLLTSTVAVGQNRVISFVMAVVISGAVYLFLKLHRLGKAVRATALNPEVAMVCGINVRRIYLVTTGLGAALATAGGALVSIQFGFNPETGVLYTLQAFAIIILGGRGHRDAGRAERGSGARNLRSWLCLRARADPIRGHRSRAARQRRGEADVPRRACAIRVNRREAFR